MWGKTEQVVKCVSNSSILWSDPHQATKRRCGAEADGGQLLSFSELWGKAGDDIPGLLTGAAGGDRTVMLRKWFEELEEKRKKTVNLQDTIWIVHTE